MAFSAGNNKKVISDINVTPLVDVMLVLLVIFMITAPLMLSGIKLELPKTKEVNPLNLNTQQVVLDVTAENEFYIGKEKKVLAEELIGEIKALFNKNDTEVLYLRADFSLPYGKIAKLMSYLKRRGINQIALVTEIEKKNR